MRKVQPHGFEGGDKKFATWITPSQEEKYMQQGCSEGSRWTYSLQLANNVLLHKCIIGTRLKIGFKSIQKDTLSTHEGDHLEISLQIQDNPSHFQVSSHDKKRTNNYQHKDRNKDNELTFNTIVCVAYFFLSTSN